MCTVMTWSGMAGFSVIFFVPLAVIFYKPIVNTPHSVHPFPLFPPLSPLSLPFVYSFFSPVPFLILPALLLSHRPMQVWAAQWTFSDSSPPTLQRPTFSPTHCQCPWHPNPVWPPTDQTASGQRSWRSDGSVCVWEEPVEGGQVAAQALPHCVGGGMLTCMYTVYMCTRTRTCICTAYMYGLSAKIWWLINPTSIVTSVASPNIWHWMDVWNVQNV